MEDLKTITETYLDYCAAQKRLDMKTIRAYSTDLRQFRIFYPQGDITSVSPNDIEAFVSHLNTEYKPKSVKRKIASLKAFFHYLEYKELISRNPFYKVQIKLREPVVLPKTIPMHSMKRFLSAMYQQQSNAGTAYQKRNALRDTAVCELLFATGMRISELCSLKPSDIDLYEHNVLIYGKGSKERKIQIGNQAVVEILIRYRDSYKEEISRCNHFFVNQSGKPFSDQSVRRMLNKYTKLASIEQHITPHMFRHTFATALLDADVDIRYIQEMLGHSSIHTTEIYTHVTLAKQKDILTTKHPRNYLDIG